MTILKIIGKWVIFIVALFWVAFLSIGTKMYLSFRSDIGFLQIKQDAIQSGWYLPAFYSHIFGSSIILIAGLFQFIPLGYFNRGLHKVLGKVYVLGVLFFASPGAYIMTLFIHRGPGVFASFFIQNTLWVICTASAWVLIKKGDVDGHVKMMRRSYALAFAAVMLRLYIWLCHVLGNGVDFQYNYLIISFLSWVPNLIVVEIINRRSATPLIAKPV